MKLVEDLIINYPEIEKSDYQELMKNKQKEILMLNNICLSTMQSSYIGISDNNVKNAGDTSEIKGNSHINKETSQSKTNKKDDVPEIKENQVPGFKNFVKSIMKNDSEKLLEEIEIKDGGVLDDLILSNGFNKKDKIKSNLERIIPTLDKKFILMMKKYNKIRNNDDKNELDIYNKKKQNYLPICELSPLDVHNSIPNLFPNDVSIIFILREYIKKNLCQKLLEKEFYYKNIQVNLVSNKSNKSNRFNRSYKSSKESKNKSKTNINNKSFSKSIFNKKNNYINNHNNIRRK